MKENRQEFAAGGLSNAAGPPGPHQRRWEGSTRRPKQEPLVQPDMVSSISWKAEFLPLAQRFATQTAVVDRDGAVSYAELFARAAGIGRALLATGVVPCQPVGILLANGRDAVAASYAVTLAGGAETRLNTALAADDLAHCVRAAGIGCIVTDEAHAPLIGRLGVRVLMVGQTAPADPAGCEFPAVAADGCGRIGFTSGTTGKPKGIVHSHAGRWNANILLRAALPFAPRAGDNILLMTPFSHGAALLTYAFLDGGAAVTLLAGVDPAVALGLIQAGKVNQMFAPPTALAKLVLGAGGGRYEGLKAIFTGTAPLTGDLYRRARRAFGPVIRVTYGKTEIWNPITVLSAREADAWYGDTGEPTSTCVGWPASGVEITIGDIEGEKEMLDDATGARIGLVHVRARHMSVGRMEAGRFTPDPPDGPHNTGDFGFIDGAGRLHLCGRAGDVMKSGGYRILPEEVEAPLREAVATTDVCVIGLPSSYWGEIVTAVVVGSPPPALADAMARLSGYKRPRLVAELDEIPRNAIGKVVRGRVRERVLARYCMEDGPYPRLLARPHGQ
jgi:acyl-CoA synthetase (AMP-forming)/AMP-acid ligase II